MLIIREAILYINKLWSHFIKWWPPPCPPFMKSLFIFFPTIFWAKKKMILRVVWGVLMGVLGVFEGCCRVFEVCLKGVWKNKIEVWNQSDPPPPPLYEIISQKIFFFTNEGFPKFQFLMYYTWIDVISSTKTLKWNYVLVSLFQYRYYTAYMIYMRTTVRIPYCIYKNVWNHRKEFLFLFRFSKTITLWLAIKGCKCDASFSLMKYFCYCPIISKYFVFTFFIHICFQKV